MANDKEEECRLVIFGSGGVGKSALTVRMITGQYLSRYDPTIEDSYRKQLVIDGKACVLDIFDTAGPEEFSSSHELYMRTGQGFALVYSITSRTSFEAVPKYYDRILRVRQRYGGVARPMVLVGNKCDLEDMRAVPTKEGAELALSLGCSFLESSAKAHTKVEDIFIGLARQVLLMKESEQYRERMTKDRCIMS